MNAPKPGQRALISAICAFAATSAIQPAAAAAATSPTGDRPTATHARAAGSAHHRIHLGEVTRPTDFEVSTRTGRYVFAYAVTGVCYFDTYVNGVELGYVGGPTGVYRTREVELKAGVQRVAAVGPHGSCQADLYLIRAF